MLLKMPPDCRLQITETIADCRLQTPDASRWPIADYVGYTARHLHQRINEHKYSAIGRHLEQHYSNTKCVFGPFFAWNNCNAKWGRFLNFGCLL